MFYLQERRSKFAILIIFKFSVHLKMYILFLSFFFLLAVDRNCSKTQHGRPTCLHASRDPPRSTDWLCVKNRVSNCFFYFLLLLLGHLQHRQWQVYQILTILANYEQGENEDWSLVNMKGETAVSPTHVMTHIVI